VPHFSIKDLLVSMSLVAFGLGVAVTCLGLDPPWVSLGSFGLMLIGAGMLRPFDRAGTGAGVGCLLYLVLVGVLIVLYGR
jgi:hypothetical protein